MWYRNMERLKKKYETAKKYVPTPITHKVKGASSRDHRLWIN